MTCQYPKGCEREAILWNDEGEHSCGAHQRWLARPRLRRCSCGKTAAIRCPHTATCLDHRCLDCDKRRAA